MDKFMLITAWWRHQMETFYALLAICAGNSQRPVTRSFDVFFDLRLNKRLSEQSWGWWFETLSCPLWRHCNGEQMEKSQYFMEYTVPITLCVCEIYAYIYIYIIRSAVDIITLLPYIRLIMYWSASLTRCDLVVPYGGIDLGQHLFR